MRYGIICCMLAALLASAAAAHSASRSIPQGPEWRIRFLEAAVVAGPQVLLGEVAVPVGDMPPATWSELSRRELWPSPPETGKAMNMTRPRLQEAVMRTMRDLAPYCLFPGSLALQRGGAVLGKDHIQETVSRELQPLLASLEGESTFRDFRIPQHIFLKHAGQTLTVQPPQRVTPGRTNFRLEVRELDGSVVQKLSGSVFIDTWMDVPSASAPLNKDDVLEPGKVTFMRVNLAHLREAPWDGRGGPWRLMRPVGVQQVIYQTDLGHIPTVRKGSKVTLVYEGSRVRLSAKAEAMADGVAGESIPVRNSFSRREVYGVVRDGSTVVIGAAL